MSFHSLVIVLKPKMAASYNKFSEENWEAFMKIEGLKPCYAGGEGTLLQAHKGYTNQPDELIHMVESCDLPVFIIFPGGNGKLHLLHNCVTSPLGSKLMGVNGFSYFAGFKELAEKLQMDRTKGKLKVPTLEDFGKVKSGERFKELKGTVTRSWRPLRISLKACG